MITKEVVELEYHPRTTNILLGIVIGSADTEHGRLTVVGSGRTLRFAVEGHPGYIDVDMRGMATLAVRIIAGDLNPDQ